MSEPLRELRARLETAQSELKRAQDELLTAQTENVTLRERVSYLEWSLNGGRSQDLVLQLGEAKAEIARLRRQVGAPPEVRAAPRKPVVCLMVGGSFDLMAQDQIVYVAFVVDENGRASDLVRTNDSNVARRRAEEEAKRLGVELEDLV